MKKIISSILSNILSINEIPYEIEVIAENLNVPWSMDMDDEGSIYFTERTGTIRIIKNGRLHLQPLIRFRTPFSSQGERGLMGIALDLGYSQNHYIYAMHSYIEGNQIYNRVVRLIVQNDQASIDKVILDKITGGRIHNGGRIKIGPDNKLYVTTGDAGDSSLSQDVLNTAGKVLRIELDGSIPADNPFNNSLVYCLGLRNPQGLAWNRNIMYGSDHGQSAHDEINILEPGANYGWPIVQGDETLRQITVQKPLIQSNEETWAPSGLAFAEQGSLKGKLIAACLRGEQLLVFDLNEKGTSVKKAEPWLKNEYGRLRDVFLAKDGSIYILTNNTDGRGNPDSNDDKILRLIPLN